MPTYSPSLRKKKVRSFFKHYPVALHFVSLFSNWCFFFGGGGWLDQVTYSWSQAQITGRAPCGRYGHTASVVGHNIFIFGGNAGTNMRLNDIHILNTEEMQWESPSVGGIAPCERSGHTASVVGNRIFIFGGYSYAGGEWLNDMYVFNTG